MPSAAVEQRRSEPFLDRTTVSAIDIIPELEGAAQHRLAPLGHRRPNRPTLHADPHRNFALRKAGLADVLAIVAPELGRAPGRASVSQYGYVMLVAVPLKKKKEDRTIHK